MGRRVLFLLFLAALVVAGCSKDKADRKEGSISKAGAVSVFDVHVGDCLDPGDELGGEIADIKAVPCADAHTHEVFALPEYPGAGDVYPGDVKLADFANAQCLEAFGNYTGTDYLDSKLFFSYLQPSIRSWNDGDDRRVVCVVVSNGKQVTGSVRVAGATTTTEKPDREKTKAERQAESRAKAAAREKAREKLKLNH